MRSNTQTISINSPADKAFAFVADPSHLSAGPSALPRPSPPDGDLGYIVTTGAGVSAVTTPPDRDPLRPLLDRARSGDADALDKVVRAVQDDVCGLAVRMLWDPHDAEDATQEILVKVVTRLGSFRGDCALRTCVYRVAVNHLLSTRRRRLERQGWTFAAFADDLAAGLDPHAPAEAATPTEGLLAEEVKIGYTLGMLQCLDRPQRIAYILGEVFGLPSETAARICRRRNGGPPRRRRPVPLPPPLRRPRPRHPRRYTRHHHPRPHPARGWLTTKHAADDALTFDSGRSLTVGS